MTAYLSADRPVYLLALLSKGDASNFDDDEIAEMKKIYDGAQSDEAEEERLSLNLEVGT